MSHTRIALLVLFSLVPMGAFAADKAPVAAGDALSGAAVAAPADAPAPLSLAVRQVPEPAARPKALGSLYAATVALHGYDAYSTLTAVRAGHIELNPMMQPLVGRPALFITVKAGIAASTIYSAEQLWKKGQRKQAVAVMLITNGFMAWVDMHNAALLRATR